MPAASQSPTNDFTSRPTSEIDFEEQAALIGHGPGVCMVAREDMLKLFEEITRLRKELMACQKLVALRSQECSACIESERQARDETFCLPRRHP